jgi:hypothetical protein
MKSVLSLLLEPMASEVTEIDDELKDAGMAESWECSRPALLCETRLLRKASFCKRKRFDRWQGKGTRQLGASCMRAWTSRKRKMI